MNERWKFAMESSYSLVFIYGRKDWVVIFLVSTENTWNDYN
jgi:hypothetical protein